jgi:hypothetical protein
VLTRRTFHIVTFSLGAAAFCGGASSQQGDMVTIRIRADESVRAKIPPIGEGSLTIEPDQSEEAKDLARRTPPGRAFPIIFTIVGAIALTELLQMIQELLRKTYYGGVLIDMRTQPPSVTSDPKIPANLIFVIDTQGKTSQFTNDQLSLDMLKLALSVK